MVAGRVDPDRRHPEDRSVTDAEGRYRFKPQAEPYPLVVVHDVGFARREPEELMDSPDVMVARGVAWKELPAPGTKILAEQPIRLSVDATRVSSNRAEIYEYSTETDANGHFAIDRVVPGHAFASTGTRVQATSGKYGSISTGHFEVGPGETKTIAIGGTGCPVVGRLVLPEGSTAKLSFESGPATLAYQVKLPAMPTPPGYAAWPPEKKASYAAQWNSTRR